jgi:hypothetical protein
LICKAARLAGRCPTFGERSGLIIKDRNVHEKCSCGYYDYVYYHIYLGYLSHHSPLVATITRICQVFINSAVIVYLDALSHPYPPLVRQSELSNLYITGAVLMSQILSYLFLGWRKITSSAFVPVF